MGEPFDTEARAQTQWVCIRNLTDVSNAPRLYHSSTHHFLKTHSRYHIWGIHLEPRIWQVYTTAAALTLDLMIDHLSIPIDYLSTKTICIFGAPVAR